MSASFTDTNKIRVLVYKPDYKSFSVAYDPYVMLKRDSPESNAPNLASAYLKAEPSIILISGNDLDSISFPSDNILKLYVRLENSGGAWAWVGPVKIERIQPFPKPKLYDPSNNSKEVSRLPQNFDWQSLPGNPDSPTYRIVVSTDSSFSGFVDKESGRYCSNTSTCWTKVTTASSLPGFNLGYGQKFYWRVRAGNSIAGGDWSDTWSFTTETQKTKPTAKIKSISPNPTDNETYIKFVGTGNDQDGGSITGYNWRSNIDGYLSNKSSFSEKLSVGNHTIYFKVKDDENVWSDEVNEPVTVRQKKSKPIANNMSISPTDTNNEKTISFSGSGYDPDGGSITGYNWRSSIDSYLSNQSSFSRKLSVGNHTIYYKVKDDEGVWSDEISKPVKVTQKKTKPVANNMSISHTDTNNETSISFSGSGYDPDGGSITDYNWRSSIDSYLNDQASFSKKLSVGNHTIYYKVKDDEGVWSDEISKSVKITQKTSRPVVDMMNISHTSTDNETSISFSGAGSDPDGGEIQSYNWRSSIDSFLSSEDSFSSILSVGTHTIYFKVQDDENAWSEEESQQVTVSKRTSKPTARIETITPNPATTNDMITFNGTGIDSDGNILNYSWESSIDGALDGTSKNLNSFSQQMSAGEHQICFKVKDNDDLWSDEVCQTLLIQEPEQGAVAVYNDQPISNITIQVNETHLYYIDVPNDATALIVKTTDVNDDSVDLYISKDKVPTIETHEIRSFSGKSNERIRIDAIEADGYEGTTLVKKDNCKLSEGRYYILVHSAKDGGTYGLHARYLSLEFPFAGSQWKITRAYDNASHSSTNQRYSLDFAQKGCDSYGKPILAAAAGKVSIGPNNAFGRHVFIHHDDGYKTLYAHLATISVKKDSLVQKGQEVGTCGNTGKVEGRACGHHGGTHLHFTFIKDSKGIKPEAMSGERDFKEDTFFDGSELNNPRTFVIVDNQSADINSNLKSHTEGYMGEMQYLLTSEQAENGITATWRPHLQEKNQYAVYAHIPKAKSTAIVRYKIHYADGDSEATINQHNYNNQWVRLGDNQSYSFNAGTDGYVSINTKDIENNKSVGIDAILWTTAEWGAGGGVTPEIPLNLSATETPSHHVHLTWQTPTGTRLPEKYNIYRNEILLETIASSQLSFTDQSVANETSYAYQVSAIYDTEEGDLCKQIFVTTSPREEEPEKQLPENWASFDASAYTYQLMMTAELWDSNDLLIAKDTDVLGAFVGDECRGYAFPKPGPNETQLFYLQIWSNKSNEETISFRYYNMDTGEVSGPLNKYITFKADEAIGSVVSPVQIKIISTITQTLTLHAGWNWIAFYAVPDDMSLNAVFSEIQDSCERIVSQKGYSEYLMKNWYGPLQHIEFNQMYMLKMVDAATLSIEGRSLTSEELNLSLHQNWNWTPFLLNIPLSLNNGLASIDNSCERIVGQKGYAEYLKGWWGSLENLEPGAGYKIFMKQSGILTYPQINTTKRMKSLAETKPGFEKADQFEYQATITGFVDDDIDIRDQIMPYINNELRGSGKIVQTPEGYRCFIQVWSDTRGETIHLKYFDVSSNQLRGIDQTVEFQPDMSLGSITTPEKLTLKSNTDIDDASMDINGDQVIDMKDLILMLQILSGFVQK
jgi:hypothetical protein